ncbi:MAG: sulfite exporter TauE/SafE family protein [Bacteroidota bacterium]
MINPELSALVYAAAGLGFVHTLLGPDHYLPFIAMSRSGGWNSRKTLWITVLCGLGHVLSSVLLGLLGIVLGIGVSRLEDIESTRGDLAAWALIAFGLVYMVWGLRKAFRDRQHGHVHAHTDGQVHEHTHRHWGLHVHTHTAVSRNKMTPWVLFTIFILGPCEPLIPLVMYPAAHHNAGGVILVTAIFGLVTIVTMTTIVMITLSGVRLLPLSGLERFTHAISGGVILLCGLSVRFLGL